MRCVPLQATANISPAQGSDGGPPSQILSLLDACKAKANEGILALLPRYQELDRSVKELTLAADELAADAEAESAASAAEVERIIRITQGCQLGIMQTIQGQ